MAGLDPTPSRLPDEILNGDLKEKEAVRCFCLGILEAVEPEVAAVKLQAAYFERLGPDGMGVYADLIAASEAMDLPTIADVKRGDIGSVAAAYAEAHLSVYGARCVTVNPYMGEDAVLPFAEEARRSGRGGGVFVLVATSNPSAGEIQFSGQPPLFETVAKLAGKLGGGDGERPDVGAVVGVTQPEVGLRVRELLPEALFLAPGYGAQGGGAEGVRALLDSRGGGVLVNSSRALIYAYQNSGKGYKEAAREAARGAREDLRALGAGM